MGDCRELPLRPTTEAGVVPTDAPPEPSRPRVEWPQPRASRRQPGKIPLVPVNIIIRQKLDDFGPDCRSHEPLVRKGDRPLQLRTGTQGASPRSTGRSPCNKLLPAGNPQGERGESVGVDPQTGADCPAPSAAGVAQFDNAEQITRWFAEAARPCRGFQRLHQRRFLRGGSYLKSHRYAPK